MNFVSIDENFFFLYGKKDLLIKELNKNKLVKSHSEIVDTNDVVLDPFMGSGTTAVASIQSDRYFVGYENNKDYIKLSKERILSSNKIL